MNSAPTEKSELWLLRKWNQYSADIQGPFYESQVKEMLLGSYMNPKDELCPSNGYWFSVDSFEEIYRHFNIEKNILVQALENRREKALDPEGTAAGEESKTITNSLEAQSWQPKTQAGASRVSAPIEVPATSVKPKRELLNLWPVFIFLLSILAGMVFIWILRLLRGEAA